MKELQVASTLRNKSRKFNGRYTFRLISSIFLSNQRTLCGVRKPLRWRRGHAFKARRIWCRTGEQLDTEILLAHWVACPFLVHLHARWWWMLPSLRRHWGRGMLGSRLWHT